MNLANCMHGLGGDIKVSGPRAGSWLYRYAKESLHHRASLDLFRSFCMYFVSINAVREKRGGKEMLFVFSYLMYIM